MRCFFSVLSVFSVVILIFLSFAPALAQDEPPPTIPTTVEPTRAQARAAVFLMQTRTGSNGQQLITCAQSGTLVSIDGLILTNAHGVQPNTHCPGDSVVVAFAIREDEPPVPVYYADPVAVDAGLDLAVLRITRYLDGRQITPGELVLPFVELGDSKALQHGDPLLVVGYPGIGREAVGARAGTISAFLAELWTGSRAWIKTESSIPGDMSGGGAYNDQGQLVGVPTIAPAAAVGQPVDCRAIQDTNDDGLIDTRDACVPVGSTISALRPAHLARSLIRAAQLGLRPGADPSPTAAAAGAPAFSRLFFAPSVDEAGQPSTVLASAPTGADRLYLFFDYANMAANTVYELRTTRNGVPEKLFSLPPTTWSGGQSGLWYIGIEGQVLPDGQYDCQLLIEGQPSGPLARINVGGPPQQVAAFTDLVFGMESGSNNTLVNSGHVLPAGIGVVQAQFVYQNMTEGLPWQAQWFYEGAEVSSARVEGAWSAPPGSGVYQVRVASTEGGMRPGRYRLDLSIGGRLAATADFVVVGGSTGTGVSIFGAITFADAAEPDGAPTGTVGMTFPAGAKRLYAFFDYRDMASGIPWTLRWSIDGEPLFTIHRPWSGAANGQNWFASLETVTANGMLSDGTYTVDLFVGSEHLQTANAVLGAGAVTQRAARPLGVQVSGDIVDAETGRGIPGALFTVLRAEFSVEDFVWDADQVLASVAADQDGRFEIPLRLPPELYYSVVISAEGYLPISADGILIDEDTPDPLKLRVEMNKD
ncbi:MAG: trypsin-like peptidase domain-containing protein [Anaerolineae bacterium]|nr:trypsin-like peptidase domain-containing protein [Anaerolineae bacterium]